MNFFRQKTSFLVFGLILMIGIIAGVILVLKSPVSWSVENNLSLDNQNSQIDQDNDGLPDWQEKLFSTNLNNPDTDNDGFLDGEEIASGHNPRKPAPDDEIDDKESISGNLSKSPSGLSNSNEANLTELLSKTITNELSNKQIQSPKDLFSFDLNSLQSSSAFNQAVIEGTAYFALPEITDQEINLSANNSKEVVESYLNSVLTLLRQNLDSFNKEDIDIIEETITSGQSSAEIEKRASAYRSLYLALKAIAIVPDSCKEIHKKTIQIVWLNERILASIANIQNDPLKTFIAIKEYEKATNLITETYELAYNLIKKMNIVL